MSEEGIASGEWVIVAAWARSLLASAAQESTSAWHSRDVAFSLSLLVLVWQRRLVRSVVAPGVGIGVCWVAARTCSLVGWAREARLAMVARASSRCSWVWWSPTSTQVVAGSLARAWRAISWGVGWLVTGTP